MKFTEKLKTNAKFKKQFIAITSVSLAAVICAVGIPVGVHYSKQTKPAIDTQEGSASVLTTTDNGTNIDGEFLSEEEIPTANEELTTLAAAEDVTEPNAESAKDDPAKPVSNSSSSAKKPNTTKKETTTKKVTTTKAPAPETTTKAQQAEGTYGWTTAQANAFVAKSRAYGESIGLVWDDSFSIEAQNASWNAGVWTSKNISEKAMFDKMCEHLEDHKYGNRKATRFKIQAEYINDPDDCYWDFTILYM